MACVVRRHARVCADNCSSPSLSCVRWVCGDDGGHVQCFLRESDVGRARAEACVDRLAELNSYVSVSLLSRPLNAQTVSSFSVRGHLALLPSQCAPDQR